MKRRSMIAAVLAVASLCAEASTNWTLVVRNSDESVTQFYDCTMQNEEQSYFVGWDPGYVIATCVSSDQMADPINWTGPSTLPPVTLNIDSDVRHLCHVDYRHYQSWDDSGNILIDCLESTD